MKFKMSSLISKNAESSIFTEASAPDWLTSCNTVKGSTMDSRWFWTDHVLKLQVNESINTDFQKITRIE